MFGALWGTENINEPDWVPCPVIPEEYKYDVPVEFWVFILNGCPDALILNT